MTKKKRTWIPRNSGYTFHAGELSYLLERAFEAGVLTEATSLVLRHAIVEKIMRTALMRMDGLIAEEIDDELVHVNGILKEHNVTI